jgi:methylase of polypeptide subunit release factors
MIQLSIFDTLPHPDPSPLRYPNPQKADSLRLLADRLQPTIDHKLNPAIAQQRSTRRRARIAASLASEGERLQKIQSWLYAMALAAERGDLPDILAHIATKTQLEMLLTLSNDNWTDDKLLRIFKNPNGAYTDWLNRLKRAKITSGSQVKFAIAALASLNAPTSHDPVAIKIQAYERDIIGVDFPGYFPTPRTICEHMVKLAMLRERMHVLEPSAGKGSICEAIEKEARVHLDVCEIQLTLARILKLKGFNVIAANCFDVREQYDRILLNPPFGRGEEVKHIRHAYECLLPGGRIVAIAPESITFRREPIYREFREWLLDKCFFNEALPDGSFLLSDRPTHVRTRILVIEKQSDKKQKTKNC